MSVRPSRPAGTGDPVQAHTRASCLHELFEAQARQRPGAVALRAAGAEVTYDELDRGANRLARHLLMAGVARGALVAVAMPRSAALVTSVLAVLKAGAAYLPLDPADPPARLRDLLVAAEPALVLTLDAVAGALPAGGPPVVAVDGERTAAALRSLPARPPEIAIPAGAPACLIFTSGTTGRPKGVLLTHGGLTAKVRWERAELGIGGGDRFLQLAAVGFSVAVLELFSPLCSGAELVLGPAGRTPDVQGIASLVGTNGVTVLSLVPSELQLLLEPGLEMVWSSVRLVLTGGEALPAATVERFLTAHPDIPLVNLYGMTESSVDTTWWPCRAVPDAAVAPIGHPVTGAEVHVLDDDLRPVLPGATGELYVGGGDLALGYAGSPGLTAARFLPDPLGHGGRLYRSGDLARPLPGGALEMLGRRDHQLEVHGIRVEPEEIEALLSRHPSVSRAAVVLRETSASVALAPDDSAGWTRLLQGIGEDELDRILGQIERMPAR